MPLDDISINFGRVARTQIGGDTETFPDILKIRIFPNRDIESCGLEMAHPTCTATAIRILVNPNDGSLCSRRGYRGHQCRRDNSQSASARYAAYVFGL